MSTPGVDAVDIAGVDVPTGHHIGGAWVPGAERIDVVSPIDERTLGSVPAGGAAEVDAAVRAARDAFESWSQLGVATRVEHLRALAAEIARRAEDLAVVECHGSGLPLAMLRRYVPDRIRRHIDHYADLALALTGESIDGPETRNRVTYLPAGVAAVISPWNGPLSVSTAKMGPALAAGDTVVIKPPEWAPLSCNLLAAVARDAGMPDGVVNVVHGYGAIAGSALAGHPGVDRISLTGSPPTARAVAAAAAPNLVPLCFELGGKSALLVFADADLEAASAAIASQYFHATQICAAGTRILVDAEVADELLDRVRRRVADLVVGDPREPATAVGPLISRPHLARVEGFVERAVAAGARVLWGGRRAAAGGLYYEPTMLTDVTPDMEIWQSEVFGPVLLWDTFEDVEEAVAKANSTEYGLAAHLWTGDAELAERVGNRVVAGNVWVNCSNMMTELAAPFGGARSSGIGREGGRWSFEFFAEVRNTASPVGDGQSHLIAPGGH